MCRKCRHKHAVVVEGDPKAAAKEEKGEACPPAPACPPCKACSPCKAEEVSGGGGFAKALA